MPTDKQRQTILIVGASRGLGAALAGAFATEGWQVIGTVRDREASTPLHALAEDHSGRIEIARLDICRADQIEALRESLAGRTLDILFVNAGTTNDDLHAAVGQIPMEEFARVMQTNAQAPMQVIEALEPRVAANGLIGAMSSGQGSITDNVKGGRELYRGSKAALNMFMRSYAARQAPSERGLLLLAPGWIQTDLGGEDATYTLEESTPKLIDVILSRLGQPGLVYLNRDGQPVAW